MQNEGSAEVRPWQPLSTTEVCGAPSRRPPSLQGYLLHEQLRQVVQHGTQVGPPRARGQLSKGVVQQGPDLGGELAVWRDGRVPHVVDELRRGDWRAGVGAGGNRRPRSWPCPQDARTGPHRKPGPGADSGFAPHHPPPGRWSRRGGARRAPPRRSPRPPASRSGAGVCGGWAAGLRREGPRPERTRAAPCVAAPGQRLAPVKGGLA